MGRDLTFGQYYPQNSFLHKMDPRVKLIIIIAYTVSVFLVKSLYAYIVVAAFLLIEIAFSKVPPIKVFKSLKGILLIMTITSFFNLLFVNDGEILYQLWIIKITMGGVMLSVNLIIRIVLLVAGASMLTFTTTPMSITDGMESLMKPLKVIKVPVHDIALIMSIALRFIPILMEEVDKIMMAQKARGAAFDNGGLIKRTKALLPVLIPLFVSAFRRAEELALALDARCYNATPKRTKLKELKVGIRDFIALIMTAAFIFLIIAVNNGFWGLF